MVEFTIVILGNGPVRLLPVTLSVSSVRSALIHVGNVPCKLIRSRFSVRSGTGSATLPGMVPCSVLLDKSIKESLGKSAALNNVAGMKPPFFLFKKKIALNLE